MKNREDKKDKTQEKKKGNDDWMKGYKRRYLFVSLCMVLLLAGCGLGKHKSVEEKTMAAEKENVQEEGTTGEILTETEQIPEVTVDGMSLDILKNMTLEEKIGQMLFVGLDTLRADGKNGKLTKMNRTIKGKIEAWSPGGVILYGKNMEDKEQITELTEELQQVSRIPLLIGTEEEGGENSRIASQEKIEVEETEEAQRIGEAGDRTKAQETGQIIGSYMKEMGFNLNFAPVADVSETAEHTIMGSRTYGSDAEVTSDMAAAFIRGIQAEGVSAVLKYFPGQGSLTADTHKGAADIIKTIKELRKTEFKPFSAGIDAGVDFIMVGHASVSSVTENQTPASLSKLMIAEILRNELQFDSVVITDSMNMKAITETYSAEEAAAKAVKAGADMILCPDNGREAYEGIRKAVKDGEIEEKRLDESVLRILRVKIRRGMIPEDTELIRTGDGEK